MLTLAIFPLTAILWLLIHDKLGIDMTGED